MKRSSPWSFLPVALAAGLSLVPAPAGAAESPKTEPDPLVQIALLLDTSGSMEGLINQARSQLWKIVNEFINAKSEGRRPELQVALYEYGKSSLTPQSGWIRQIQPFTTDLDKISEELFALKTNGGEEFCGWVIKDATEQLSWSKSPKDYRAIFIAGNEPFTQGPVDYRASCKAAIEKGIIVNTIHCGSEQEGINGQWRDGALLAEGKFMLINHNQAVVHFQAPQDEEITRLGAELNRTYVAYGFAGREASQRQFAQDANARAEVASGAALQRSLAKASVNYRNANWDLVDAFKENPAAIKNLKPADLPADLRTLSEAERNTQLEAKLKERTALQAKINQLNVERNKFVTEQTKKSISTNTLDTVVVSTIREQAAKRNFKFE